MAALFTALLKGFPTLCQSDLYATISSGALIGQEAHRAATVLMADLKPLLHDELYVVLDDLHFLEDAETSLFFLSTLIGQAPRGLRFILLSRTKVNLTSENTLHLGREISERQLRIILARAGHWFKHQHHYERALLYYLKAKAYGMAEKILRTAVRHRIEPGFARKIAKEQLKTR